MRLRWLLVVVFSAVSAFAEATSSAGSVPPAIAPPPGLTQVHEFRLQGAMLERMSERHTGLEGIRSVVVRRYAPSSTRRSRPPIDREALARSLREHYTPQMQALKWVPLVQDDIGARQGAAYTSPDGLWLFAFNTDSKGAVTTLVEGQVALYQMPDLERVIVHSLGHGRNMPSEEELRVSRQAQDLLKSGRADKAVELLQDQVTKRPDSVALRLSLARAYDKIGKKRERVAQLKAAIALDPAAYGLRLEYGRALMSVSDNQEALFQFEQAAALAPDRATPSYFIGCVYQGQSEYEKALKAFSRASDLGGERWPSLAMRQGEVYEKIGDRRAAERLYRRALEIRPGYEEAQQALARLRAGG